MAKRYDWKALLSEYMFEGKEPLINGLVSGREFALDLHRGGNLLMFIVCHPLIHLAYAYELDSRTIAIEALAMGSCFYGPLHKYIDDPSYTKPSPFRSASLLDILEKVREDKRFDGLYNRRSGETEKVFKEKEEELLEYWNAWDLSNPKEQFQQSQELATIIVLGTEAPEDARFDFFFVHLLTSSHAVRILLPIIPVKYHIKLVRQWWLFVLAVYITQVRPKLNPGAINDFDLKGRDWKHVTDAALNGTHSLDTHFVKGKLLSRLAANDNKQANNNVALRKLHVASETWGDESQFYLKAAVKFFSEFDHWGGFHYKENDVKYYEGQKIV